MHQLYISNYALYIVSIVCFVIAAFPTVFNTPKVRFEWLGVAFATAAYIL